MVRDCFVRLRRIRNDNVWLVLIVIFVTSGRVWAQDSVDLSYFSYSDNKSIYYKGSGGSWVQSPFLSMTKGLTDRTTVRVRYNADAISAASRRIDAVTSASPRARQEFRHEGHIEARYAVDGYTLAAGYGLSRENDYASDYPLVALTKELFEKNTVLGVRYFHLFDRIFPIRVDLPGSFPKAKDTDNLSLSATQVLDPMTIANLTYTYMRVRGFISNYYHVVRLEDYGIYTLENLPSLRQRHAILVKVNRALTSRYFLGGDYRFYTDSWGVTSHTADARASMYVTPDILLQGRYRVYVQGPASFYTTTPTKQTQYPTIDGRLASFTSHLLGAKISYQFEPGIGQGAEVYALYERYIQTTGLSGDILQCSVLFLF